ncbi:MAG: DUF4386 domain-containing protein [Puniceicoccaceae bacterium]
MATNALNKTQRNAASLAGFTFIFALIIVVVANYGVSFRLSIPGKAEETARNIVENEGLWRFNIFCNLLYATIQLILLSSLYVILKPAGRNLAMIAAFCRLLVSVMWGVTSLMMLASLRILGGSSFLNAFETNQLHAMVRLLLDFSYDAYYIGLPFWTLSSCIVSYLWFKSRYIPRALAVFGIFSSVWCVFCAFTFIISSDFQYVVHPTWYDMPIVVFELALGIWLIFKGLKLSVAKDHSSTSA